MKFEAFLQPMIGLGFALNIVIPLLEIVIGPLVMRFGDIDRADRADETDEDDM